MQIDKSKSQLKVYLMIDLVVLNLLYLILSKYCSSEFNEKSKICRILRVEGVPYIGSVPSK